MNAQATLVLLGVALVAATGLAACFDERDLEDNRWATIGVAYPHSLSTHCGIITTRFNFRYWLAHPPEHLRGPNPPPRWDHPTVGIMALIHYNLARFSNTATGEHVDFTPMPWRKEPGLCW